MKLTTKLRTKKTLIELTILFSLIIVIACLGPRLAVRQHFPLQDLHKRAALILGLLLTWLTKFFFLDSAAPTTANSNTIAQMQHALRGRFLGALRFLKKTIIDKHGFSTPLNKLPWYLLIGPPGAGKTTLLAYSTINFILSKQFKQEGQDKGIAASSVCDWWITRDLVLVDVPGCYTFSPPQEPLLEGEGNTEKVAPAKLNAHLGLWKNLLQLLTKYRQKNNIGALIVALHLPEIMKQNRQQQTLWFQEMKERLVECWHKFGKLPVYFVVTKCDLLPGFCEFFNDIGSDELTQPWGIPLSPRKEHEHLLDVFTLRFNALMKRLNKQLIWRLHQERNPEARPLIKDFPLQLEFLKETLSHLIKTLLAVNPHLHLEGIYLTSTTQENTSSSAATLFHQDVPSELQLAAPSPFISRAYFVKHIISYLLPHTSQHLTQRFHQKSRWFPQLTYGMSFIALLMGALWLGSDFQRGIYQITDIQRDLTQYQLYLQQNNPQNTSIATLNNALPLLNTLETAAQPVTYPSRLRQLQNYYSKKSQQTAVAVYQKALQTIIMPQIKNEFEKYLQNANENNPAQLYAALQAYLLLRQQDSPLSVSEQASTVLNTLQAISPLLSHKGLSKELAQHFQNALQTKQTVLLDNKLIRQTRNALNGLPEADLAYILLTRMHHNNLEVPLQLGTNIGTPPALVSRGTATVIPQMFTAQAFPSIIKEDLPLAAQETILGNEVLGKKDLSADTASAMITALTAQLEKNYLGHYIDIWESLVDNISLNNPKNLTETDAMIMNLVSSHSPLLQLLQVIHTQTNLPPILTNSEKLQALNTLFTQTQSQQKDSLYQIFVDLHQLHLFLQQASTAHFSKEALKAKQATIIQIRNMAEKYPEPIKNWLQTLVSCTQEQLQAEIKLSPTAEQKVVLVQSTVPSPPIPPASASKLNPMPTARAEGLADTIEKNVPKEKKPLTEPSLIKEPRKKVSQRPGYLRVLPEQKRLALAEEA